MKKISDPIVFFGSGPVAAASLRFLAEHFTIEAVVTKPRPPHHRGDVPVVGLAEELKLPLLYATNKSELDELFASKPVKSRIAALVDFGIIVSQNVIDYFPLGIINSHFSLLPEWRGADPITFSILSGQPHTGVSLMLVTAGLDEGPLLAASDPVPISNTTTTPELTEILVELSNHALSTVIPLYIDGVAIPRLQDESIQPTYSRRLTKEDSVIDWHKPADQIEREIRAFIEWPKSRTTLANKEVVITKAHVVPSNSPEAKPGDVEVVDNLLMVECGKGTLCIDRLKPAGKAEMTAAAFLAGYKDKL